MTTCRNPCTHAHTHLIDDRAAFSVQTGGRVEGPRALQGDPRQQQQRFREVLQAAATGGGDVRWPLAAGRLVAVLCQLPFPHTHDTGRQLRHLSTRGCTPPYVALRVGVMQRLHIWRLQGH